MSQFGVIENSVLKNTFLVPRLFFNKSVRKKSFVMGNKQKRLFEIKKGKQFCSQDMSKNIVDSPLGNVEVPNLLFHELITQNWKLWERKTAIVCGETGSKYTYKKIRNYAKALGAAFQNKLNLKKGDVIALILFNCPEYPIVFLASSCTGIIPTTLNPSSTVDEIKWQMEDSSAKLIVTNINYYEKCALVVQTMRASIPIVCVKNASNAEIPQGAIDLFEFFDPTTSGSINPVDIQLNDTLVLPYSSGTTGTPKGVVLTHRNVVSNMTQISHPETVIMALTTRFHQDTILEVLPMFHIYGLMIGTFYSLKDGCRLVTLPRFNPRLFVSNLFLKKVDIVYVVPPIMFLLSNQGVRAKFLKHLKYIVNAASPMPVQDAHTILEKAEHVKIVQAYGMTESSPALAHTCSKRMQKLSSIGIPVASTKLKVTNVETGEILPKKVHGELCAWGPQMMKNYLNRPEETKNAFDQDGWLRTGDIGYYDDDGDFYIVERLKDLIKVKGFQVAPAEIEETLRSHPKIMDAAVVGIPDKIYGEIPRAFIVLQKDEQMTEEEVKEFIGKKLSSYKQLRGGVMFVKDLPRNNIGKILRKELKKLL